MRDAVLGLQSFPRLEHGSLLETVGQALLASPPVPQPDRQPVRADSPEPRGDAATDAVILDVLTWVLLTKRRDGILLSAVIVQIVDQLRAAPTPLDVPPALHVAIQRLLQAAGAKTLSAGTLEAGTLDAKTREAATLEAGTLDALALRQIAVLRLLYRERFGPLQSGAGKAPPAASFFSDTLVALVTCRKYLDTRARECRETWVRDVEAAGATVLFFCGSDDVHAEATFDPETNVVHLAVGDAYEDLPAKILEMFGWIRQHRPEAFVVKIDDDCYLDAQNFLGALAYRRNHYFGRPLTAYPATFNRTWHQARSERPVNQRAIDTSPLGTRYADGGGSYVLSRLALGLLERVAATGVGLRLRAASFFEDKMVGDLLHQGGIAVSDLGYTSMQARRSHGSALPVLQIDRTFFPSAMSGIAVAHLDATGRMAGIQSHRNTSVLRPARIWPMNARPSLAHDASMLECLNPVGARQKIEAAGVICVCALRNEATLLPHLLQHYRALGVDLFLMVDNLSDDGSREYLHGQPDVVLFSAANLYSQSHYGVDWQRVLLDHFCPGRWVVVADADEFLLLPDQGAGLKPLCAKFEAAGHDAALVLMADMYPKGALEAADFAGGAPGQIATGYDGVPVQRWLFNQGPFGNLGSYVSALRHRLMPLSQPTMFTAQKVALFKFNPLMAFSEGLHFGAGMRMAPEPLAFLHYKYSAGFAAKARLESLRQQHFGGGVEYRAYLKLVEAGLTSLWQDGVSQTLDLTQPNALARLLKGVEPPFAG
jgi:hypothetical protein